jgi:uncharacterized protein (TIRG00374 family)
VNSFASSWHRTRWFRLVIKLGLSVALLLGLFLFVDQQEFWRIGQQFQWRHIWKFVLVLTLLMLAFAYRWHLLLNRTVSFKPVLYSTILGLGGNQVLPARGGDILRAVYVARRGRISVHRALSALMLEKIVDFLAVALIGIGSVTLVVVESSNMAMRVTALSISIIMLIVSVIVVWLARRGILVVLARQLFRLIRVGPSKYRHVYHALYEFSKATKGRKLIRPGLLTSIMWISLYVYTYITVAEIVDINLGYEEALLLVFVGALGLAIPAAPSGIGTFHASIVSGFILLNRSPSEGLFYAVALHGLLFIAYVVPLMLFYPAIIKSKSTNG